GTLSRGRVQGRRLRGRRGRSFHPRLCRPADQSPVPDPRWASGTDGTAEAALKPKQNRLGRSPGLDGPPALPLVGPAAVRDHGDAAPSPQRGQPVAVAEAEANPNIVL